MRPRVIIPAQTIPSRATPRPGFQRANHFLSTRTTTRTATSRTSGDYRNRPRVSNASNETTYVLTLLINRELQETMDAWRQRYYPSSLNRLPAHLMLFHALPEQHLAEKITPALYDVSKAFTSYNIAPGQPFAMGKRGVAVKCVHPDHPAGDRIDKKRDGYGAPSVTLHRHLQKKWWKFLSDQDRAPLRLHWTVTNKETDEKRVSEAFNAVMRWTAFEEARPGHRSKILMSCDQGKGTKVSIPGRQRNGKVRGLTLWRYRNGCWEDPQNFPFETDTNGS